MDHRQQQHEGGGTGAEPPPAESQLEEEVTVEGEELMDADTAAPSPVQPWLASAASAKQQAEVSQLPSSPSSIPLFSSFGLVPPAGQPFGGITSSPMLHLPPVAEDTDEGRQRCSTLEFSKEESPVSGSHRRKRSLLSDSLGSSTDDLSTLSQSSAAVQQQQRQQQQRQQRGPPGAAVVPSAPSASQPGTPISSPQHQPDGGSGPGSYLEEALIPPLPPPRASLTSDGAPLQPPPAVTAASSTPLPWQKPSAQSPWALQQGGAGFDSAWGGLGHAVQAERMSSASSDRRLPRLLEETESQRGSLDVPLAIKLDVVSGPCVDQHVIAGEDESQLEVGGREKWRWQGRCWRHLSLPPLSPAVALP